MLYCFTDESYSSKNYFQGALIVKEADLIKLEELIEEILLLAHSHGVPSRVEIHGHSIMNAAKGWQALDRKLALKIVVLKKFFS